MAGRKIIARGAKAKTRRMGPREAARHIEDMDVPAISSTPPTPLELARAQKMLADIANPPAQPAQPEENPGRRDAANAAEADRLAAAASLASFERSRVERLARLQGWSEDDAAALARSQGATGALVALTVSRGRQAGLTEDEIAAEVAAVEADAQRRASARTRVHINAGD